MYRYDCVCMIVCWGPHLYEHYALAFFLDLVTFFYVHKCCLAICLLRKDEGTLTLELEKNVV